jgi:phospholipid/cholesterol/gamma-HCH transport system permease protein
MMNRQEKMVEHLGDATWKALLDAVDLFSFIGELTVTLVKTLRHPNKIRWRETFYYMDQCGCKALPITIIICLLMGLILGFQGAVQLRKVGTDIFLADFVGLSILKELGPLMVAMIATGRAGSAFAAEIGTMKVSEEVDALETMGFSPQRFLVIPKLLAMLLMMPLLTIFGNIAGILGGFIVGISMLQLPPIAYYNRTIAAISPTIFSLGLIKSACFAIIITVVGCMRGFQAENDAQSVGRSTTSAVVTAIFWIVIADWVLTMIFTMMGY